MWNKDVITGAVWIPEVQMIGRNYVLAGVIIENIKCDTQDESEFNASGA